MKYLIEVKEVLEDFSSQNIYTQLIDEKYFDLQAVIEAVNYGTQESYSDQRLEVVYKPEALDRDLLGADNDDLIDLDDDGAKKES